MIGLYDGVQFLETAVGSRLFWFKVLVETFKKPDCTSINSNNLFVVTFLS